MKKALSVILAMILLMSCFATAFAADEEIVLDDSSYAYNECKCENCKYKDCKDANCSHAKDCNCCIYCSHLDESLIIKQCVNYYYDENGNRWVNKCCANCRGIWPCDCGTNTMCGCKTCNGDSIDKDTGDGEPILTPEQQEQVVDGFQKVIKIVSDVFNQIFEAIFKFLRIDEILGKK